MKKLLLIAVVALGVISCNKDKEQEEVEPQLCGAVTKINYDSGGYYVILDSTYKHYTDHGSYQYGQIVCTY